MGDILFTQCRVPSLFLKYSILLFVRPSQIICNHASLWKSRAFSFANFLTSTVLIESQYLESSVCRFSWSKWRNIVVTILEINTAKGRPCETLAWKAIHFFSFVGMIFPVLRVHVVITHDVYTIKVAIPSICKPENTSHVVISRETERLWIRFMITKQRSGQVLNCSEIFENQKEKWPLAPRKISPFFAQWGKVTRWQGHTFYMGKKKKWTKTHSTVTGGSDH